MTFVLFYTIGFGLLTGCNTKSDAEDSAAFTLPPPASAELAFSPASLDFGELTLSEVDSARLYLTVENVGETTLGPVLFETGSEHFIAGEWVLLEPDEAVEVPIDFVPQEIGALNDTLLILSEDPDQPEIELRMSGASVGGRLGLNTKSLYLGTPSVGCTLTTDIALSNSGNAPLTISELLIDSPLAIDTSLLPMTLLPDDPPWIVSLSYSPERIETIDQLLQIQSDDPFDPVVSLPVDGASMLADPTVEIFEQPLTEPVDVLFAIDKSCSMDDYIAQLENNMPTFIETLVNLETDYHIAAVVADDGCVTGPAPYLDTTSSLEQQLEAFSAMLDGTPGTFTEAPFQLMINAFAQSGTASCNDGFLRDTAKLVTITLADEREQSPNGWEYYVNLFEGLKADSDSVVMNAIAADYPDGCDALPAGAGYYEAAQETDGLFLSICHSNYSEHLAQLANHTAGVNTSFKLSTRPAPETLEVLVNDIVRTDWTYLEDRRLVRFPEASAPERGSTIEVRYQLAEYCE